ncbi:MAG: BtaA family protein [Bacteroidota bacterium]|nr:BtaA family protein [Bacteroidota bacterium]
MQPAALTEKVNFNLLRYANCWEDADILLEGLPPSPGSKILSIASAGDNSFSLLTTNPAIVVATDINKIQLFLCELKKAAIKKLNRSEVLQFLGFSDCEKRMEIFHQIKSDMSNEAILFWNKNTRLIVEGIIYSGKFEKYFSLFSQKILPLIHSQKTTAKLFLTKTKKEQEIFYDKKWNTWRWKLLFKVFFSRFVMGRLGRDPAFMKEVAVSVSQNIYNKAAIQLRSTNAFENYILRFCLTGNYGNLLPHYLREENFGLIKRNIDSLIITKGYAQEAIDHYGKFAAMNLSNIFEYMDRNTFTQTAAALVKGTENNGKIAYWNLMVPRRISSIFPAKVTYLENESRILTSMDKGFFYNEFIIDKVNG